jgi:hypothetical protein
MNCVKYLHVMDYFSSELHESKIAKLWILPTYTV